MNNSKKVVITLIIVTFILTGIISYYFIADNEKIIIQAPAITIEVNGSKNVINFTVIEVICNFTNQNNLSNFSYSISNFNQQNVSWNYLGENKSNDPQLDFIDDTTSIGFLSATDRFIVKCSTIHYQLLTLKFNPTNEIIYKSFSFRL